jgi:ABC-type glycerol-3-phosphate transport system substrate-binding protein
MLPQVRLTRRTLLVSASILAAAAAVPFAAACGATPPATSTPAAPPTPTSAPANAPADKTPTPAQTAAAKEAASGKLNVWFSANWNTVTDQVIGQIFVDWGKQNGVQVEWQSIPGTPQILQKESAAVAAGAPPEIDNNNNIYWYSQGERADLTELVNKFKNQGGGIPDVAIANVTAGDRKIFAAPYAIDPWPAHWRKDVIEPVTGGGFFKTWEDLLELGPKIQQPPRTYAIALATGHEGDHVNNLVTLLWCYGGRLATEEGVPDIKNPANRAGIDMAVKLWKAKLVPPDSKSATTTSWNNETYQKGRAMIAINPATIYGWLVVNDKALAEKTGLSLPPRGTHGAFAEAGAAAFGIFKKAKLADRAFSALEYFMQPDNLKKVSSSVEGRYVPLYRDHLQTEFWQKSAFADVRSIAEVGRIREWPAPPQPWLSDVTDAKYVLSDMFHIKILTENLSIEQAQEWAQQQMMDSYTKLVKK